MRSIVAGAGVVWTGCVSEGSEGSEATTDAKIAPPPSIPATLSKLLISNKSTLDSVLRQAAHMYHAIIDLYGYIHARVTNRYSQNSLRVTRKCPL